MEVGGGRGGSVEDGSGGVEVGSGGVEVGGGGGDRSPDGDGGCKGETGRDDNAGDCCGRGSGGCGCDGGERRDELTDREPDGDRLEVLGPGMGASVAGPNSGRRDASRAA